MSYPVEYKQSVMLQLLKNTPLEIVADRYGCSVKSIYRWRSMNLKKQKSENIIIPVKGKLKKRFSGLKDDEYSKLQLTTEALYSLSDHYDANKLSLMIKKQFGDTITVTDGTSNVGGNVISFAKYFKNVNGIEINRTNFNALKNNIKVYGFKNVSLYHGDFTKLIFKLKQDVLFLDPPWGGVDYKQHDKLKLFLSNKNISYWCKDIFAKTDTKGIVLKVPNNFDQRDFFNVVVTKKKFIHQFNKYKIIFILFESKTSH